MNENVNKKYSYGATTFDFRANSLGSTRVDRAGFERVWKEVQDYFEDDLCGEARKEAKKLASKPKKKRGSTAPKTTVGANLSGDQLEAVNERVKNLSANDMDNMLGMVRSVSPNILILVEFTFDSIISDAISIFHSFYPFGLCCFYSIDGKDGPRSRDKDEGDGCRP